MPGNFLLWGVVNRLAYGHHTSGYSRVAFLFLSLIICGDIKATREWLVAEGIASE